MWKLEARKIGLQYVGSSGPFSGHQPIFILARKPAIGGERVNELNKMFFLATTLLSLIGASFQSNVTKVL